MDIDWQQIFIPSTSVLEIFIRGSIIYLVLFLTMRFLPRRTIGSMGASDLLVVVLIADAVQNGMSDDYKSVTEAIVLAGTIIGWATLIDYLDFKFPHWHLGQGKEKPVIENGKLVQECLSKELVTEEEVMAQLRLHGQDSPRKVAKAFIEGDGQISVILESGEAVQPPRKRKVL